MVWSLWTCTLSGLHVFSDSGAKAVLRQPGASKISKKSHQMLLWMPNQKGGRKIGDLYLENFSLIRKEIGRFENKATINTVSKMTESASYR